MRCIGFYTQALHDAFPLRTVRLDLGPIKPVDDQVRQFVGDGFIEKKLNILGVQGGVQSDFISEQIRFASACAREVKAQNWLSKD